MSMSAKRRAFVDAYLANGFNATQAAKEAGYSERTAYSSGQRLLKNVEIADEIKRRMEEQAMSADEVIQAIGDIGRATIDDLMDVDGSGRPVFNFKRAQAEGKLHLIKEIIPTANGIRVVLHDRMKALELMGKHHGLFADKAELDGKLRVEVEYINSPIETPESTSGAGED